MTSPDPLDPRPSLADERTLASERTAVGLSALL